MKFAEHAVTAGWIFYRPASVTLTTGKSFPIMVDFLLIMYTKFRIGAGSAADDDDDDGKTASKHSRVKSNGRGGTGSVKEDSSRSAVSVSASSCSGSGSGSGGRVEGVFVVLATVVDNWRPIAGITDGENGCSMAPPHTTRLPPAVASDSSVGNFLTDLRTQ